jgi:hypothetical protein
VRAGQLGRGCDSFTVAGGPGPARARCGAVEDRGVDATGEAEVGEQPP